MAERLPVLSIGMPVYNGEKFIRESLDSIVGQSFGDFELVICDNGSTDATEETCREYGSSDPRIRYTRNPDNLGATANYNTVARRARGKYFKWASSNDLCQPGFFEKCVRVLEENPSVVLCYPRTRLFDSEAGTEEDYVDALHLQQDDPVERFAVVINGLSLNNVMNGVARTEAMQKTHLIPDIYCGDQSVIAELSLMGKFVEIPEFLFYRRMDQESATHHKDARDVHLHFDPSGSKPMLFQRWKLLSCFFRGVTESDLPLQTKLRLYRVLLVQARWRRRDLAEDVLEAVRRTWPSRSA